MKRKLWRLVTIIAICSLGIAAAEGGNMSVTIDQSQEMAQVADIETIFVAAELDDLAESLEASREDAEEINVLAGTPATQLQSKINKYIAPLRAEMSLCLAERNEEQRLRQREIDVANAYWQVWLSSEYLTKAKQGLTIAENQYKAAQIKFEQGSIPGTDLLSEKYNHQNTVISVVEAEHKKQKAMFDLNQLLGQSLTTDISIQGQITLQIPETWNYEIDVIFDQALQADENIYQLTKELEFAEMKLQYAVEEFQPYKDEYLDIATEKDQAEFDLKEAKNSLYMNITSAGNDLLASLADYQLLQYKLDMAEQSLAAAEIRYQLGQISKTEFLREQLSFLDNQYSLNSVVIALNNSFDSFNLKYTFVK